ncbi:MAG: gliding motility-associated C-terminal domain-containing protein [Cytophagaceae bacterium]
MKKNLLLVFLFTLLLSNLGFGATWTVTNLLDNNATTGANQGDLRWCINQACGAGGAQIISFNSAAFTGAGPFVINISGGGTQNNPYNIYGANVTIDGTTAPGFATNGNKPVVIIRGNSTFDGIQINGGSAHLIKGLIFQNLQNGINVNGGTSANVIKGCWFGINFAGTSKTGVSITNNGIYINDQPGTIIGGVAAGEGNVISGCADNATGIFAGIQINGNNNTNTNGTQIINNYIGTDYTGSAGVLPTIGNGKAEFQNQHGVIINSTSTSVITVSGNTISNNWGAGLRIISGSNAVTITGNFIGTDKTGMSALPNLGVGLWATSCNNLIIGGNTNAARNIVSGNGSATIPNVVNTAVATQWDWFNSCGIYLEECNSANLKNNYVGTDATGNSTGVAYAMGNLYAGIKIKNYGTATGATTIGGTTLPGTASPEGNVVGGNGYRSFMANAGYPGHGILLQGNLVSGLNVYRNYVGLGVTGDPNIGNKQDGISIQDRVTNCNIGGVNLGNVCGNNTFGIFIQNLCTGNKMYGNYIGTSTNGGGPAQPNSGGGIGIQGASNGNIIGGPTVGQGNFIAGNTTSTGISIRYGYPNAPANNTVIQNNNIGVDAFGATLANSTGIYIQGGSSNTTIGGSAAGTPNLIKANTNFGIELDSAQATLIRGNNITANGGDGINIHNGSASSIIGGTSAEANSISNNGGNGIQIKNPNGAGSNLNAINRNSIFCNGLRGIELNGVGNANYAKPTITGAPTSFSINSPAGAWIELYTLDGCNDCGTSTTNNKLQGKTLVLEGTAGSAAMTNINPATYGKTTNLDFTATASSAAPSATNGATTAHNTSEFSSCQVLCITPTPSITGSASVCEATNGVVYSTTNTPNTFVWTVPTGATIASGQGTSSITVNFAAGASSGNVSVLETNGGCSATSNFAVTVNPRPVTPAITGTAAICEATNGVTFSVTNTAGSTYAWTVPTGATIASGQGTNSITVNFAAGASSGNITVAQTTTATTCADLTPSTFAVTINPRPVTPAITGTASICEATTGVVFSVTNTAGNTYAWSVPAGATIASGQGTNSITVDFAAGASSGNISVTQTTTATTCADLTPSTFAVTINPRPVTPAITGTAAICEATNGVIFSVTNTAGNTYAWSVPAGATIASGQGTNSITVNFAAGASSGNISVTQTTTASTCADLTPSTFAITINPRPVTPAITGTASICEATTGVVFSVTNTAGNTYAWSVPAGATIASGQGTNSITVDFAAGASSGNISVAQTTTASTCADLTPSTFAVTINPRPVTPAITGTAAICEATNGVVFSVTNTAGNTYAWSVPTGATIASGQGTNSITVNFAAGASSGNISVTQTTTASTCADLTPSTFAVTINPRPVTPAITGTAAICDATTGVVFSVTNTAGSTYAWSVPAGATIASGQGTNSITVDFAAGASSGNISVAQTTTATTCADLTPSTFAVTVSPRPVTPAITGTAAICEATSGVTFSVTNTAGNTYAWAVPAGATIASGQGTNSITVDFAAGASSGNISVTQTTTATTCADLTPSTFAVTINPRPSTPAITGTAAVCDATNGVVFSVTNTAGNTYAWSVPTGATVASGQGTNSITVNFAAGASSGNISVTQTTTASTCADLTPSTFAVTVNPRPVTPAITGTAAICEATTGVAFSVTNTAGNTFAWAVPAGATIASGQGTNSITVDFAAGASSGNISVTQTTTATTCADLTPSTFAVTVNPRPSTPAVTGTATVCEGTNGVSYSVTNTAGATYAWAVPSGASIASGQGTNSITVNFALGATSGNITVAQTTTATTCADLTPSIFAFTIQTKPTTSAAGSDQSVCSASTNLAANVPSSGVGAWTVISGPGSVTISSSATSAVTGLTTATPTTLRWTISNAPCAASTDDVIITRQASAIPTIAITSTATSICTGTNVDFSISSQTNQGATPSYQWKLNGNPIGGATNTTYSSAGLNNNDQITLVLTSSLACASPTTATSTAITMSVAQPPSTSAAGPDQSLCAQSSATLAATTPATGTGAWSVISGTATVTTPSNAGSAVTLTGTGSFTFRWTVSSGACTPSTDDIVINNVSTPTAASAGIDQDLCNQNSASISAGAVSSGTGAWSILSGTGSETLGNSSSASTTVNNLGFGTITLRWTVSNAPCAASIDDLVIKNSQTPSSAVAGPDQSLCNQTTGTLAATAPAVGTGAWSLIGGTATITTASSATSGLTAMATGTITLRWTVSNGVCASTSDDVVINNFQNPTTASAGGDQSLCTSTATLSGNSPAVGTGTWTLVSGSGNITVPSLPNSGLTALGIGANTFRWTITNGACSASSDDVVITQQSIAVPSVSITANNNPACAGTTIDFSISNIQNEGTPTYQWLLNGSPIASANASTYSSSSLNDGDLVALAITSSLACASPAGDTSSAIALSIKQQPTTASAGIDQTGCSTSNTATLAGNSANVGSGTWSVVGGTATITNPSSATSGVTGLGTGPNTLRWTITNSPCTSSFDDVIITINQFTASNAGSDMTTPCTVTTATLSGNAAVSGSGTWALVSGSGTPVNPASASTVVNGLGFGVNKFSYIINTPGCTPSTDSVLVTVFDNPTTSLAGADQSACNFSVPVFITGNTPSVGSGLWSSLGSASLSSPSSNNTQVNSLGSGSNLFVWTISNGNCPASKDTVAVIQTAPVVNAGGSIGLCIGTAMTLQTDTVTGASGPFIYTWSQVPGTAANNYMSPMNAKHPDLIIPANAPAGSVRYALQVQAGGCTANDTLDLSINALPVISFAASDTLVCSGTEVTLSGNIVSGTPNYSYYWLQTQNSGAGPASDTLGSNKNVNSTSAQFASAAPEGMDYYHLTVKDANGCLAYSDTVKVRAFGRQNLIVPNLMTPNGDAKNDCLIIKDINQIDILPGSSMEVYNRWGESVHKAQNYSNNHPWCGSTLNDGMYYYHIKTGCAKEEIKGWIQIISNEAKQ